MGGPSYGGGRAAPDPYAPGVLRVFGPALLAVVVVVLWLYAVIDVLATSGERHRVLPKLLWLVLVVLAPVIGTVAWFGAGRPRYAGWQPGAPPAPVRPPRRRIVGPEDDPDWNGSPGGAGA
jgi:hypothetical protein